MLLLVCCYCVHVSASDALQPTVLRKHIKETVNAFLRFMFFCHHEICSTINRSYSNNAVALVSLEYNGCCWIIMLTPAAYWCSNNNYCSFLASYTNIFAFIWHILVFLDLCKVKFQQHQYVFFSLKSTQTSLQTHIISEQNHITECEITQRPLLSAFWDWAGIWGHWCILNGCMLGLCHLWGLHELE